MDSHPGVFVRVLLFAVATALSCLGPRCEEAGRWAPIGPYGYPRGPLIACAAGGDVLFCIGGPPLKSADAGATWVPMGLHSAHLLACDLAGRTLYAARDARLHRSGDGGDTWAETSLAPAEAISSLAVSPASADTVYAVRPDGRHELELLRSGDGGATWQNLGSGLPTAHLTPDPFSPGILYGWSGSHPARLYGSPDGGLTWSPAGSLEDVAQYVVHPSSPGVMLALSSSLGLFRSGDSGVTWAGFGLPVPVADVASIAASPIEPERLILSDRRGNVFLTDRGGTRWHLACETGIESVRQVLPSPTDRRRFYLRSFQGVYFSKNQGKKWSPTALSASRPTCLLARAGDAAGLYAGTYMSGLFAMDGDGPWRVARCPFGSLTCLAAPPGRPKTLYVGALGHGVHWTRDGGKTWSRADRGPTSPVDPAFIRIDSRNPKSLYSGGFFGLFHSKNGGRSWGELTLSPPPGTCPNQVYDFAFHPLDSGKMYAALGCPGIARSVDGGERWLNNWQLLGRDIKALAVIPSAPDGLVAGGAGIFVSPDGGGRWYPSGLEGMYIACLWADPLVPGRLFAGIEYNDDDARSGVFWSTHHGADWKPLGTGLEGAQVTVLTTDPVSPDVLYAIATLGNDTGVYSIRIPGN